MCILQFARLACKTPTFSFTTFRLLGCAHLWFFSYYENVGREGKNTDYLQIVLGIMSVLLLYSSFRCYLWSLKNPLYLLLWPDSFLWSVEQLRQFRANGHCHWWANIGKPKTLAFSVLISCSFPCPASEWKPGSHLNFILQCLSKWNRGRYFYLS